MFADLRHFHIIINKCSILLHSASLHLISRPKTAFWFSVCIIDMRGDVGGDGEKCDGDGVGWEQIGWGWSGDGDNSCPQAIVTSLN